MSLIINKEALTAHGVCGPGYDSFVSIFGDSSITYAQAIKTISALPESPSVIKTWLDFVRTMLATESSKPENKGIIIMTDKYFINSPTTGLYEQVESLAAAKERLSAIHAAMIADFSASVIAGGVVYQEVIVEGDATMVRVQ
jgi:hypothetical protein